MTLQHCTKGTDVTKCYQQAAGIALMICDELERHLFGTYVCTLGSTTFVGEDDPQVIAIELTNGYLWEPEGCFLLPEYASIQLIIH